MPLLLLAALLLPLAQLLLLLPKLLQSNSFEFPESRLRAAFFMDRQEADP
ncbi:MAG: hypothetical protein ABIX00_03605 [Polaromonas sp.]